MLKIKDNVDLKELEKFGFSYYDNKTSCYYGCCGKWTEKIDIFVNNARYISIFVKDNKTCFETDTLYDLIKADLVEKTDD
jgi:hypothetical protein